MAKEKKKPKSKPVPRPTPQPVDRDETQCEAPPPKRVEFKLPVPHDCPVPPEVVAVPVPFEHAKAEPLAEALPVVRCIATRWDSFWGTPYIVLTAEDGHELPDIPATGQRVDVQFSPPK